jgi:hypothetical protein
LGEIGDGRIAISAARILRAGAQWRVCRSATRGDFAMVRSGVRLRTMANDEGNLECWQQPGCVGVPKRNPHERRPQAPKREPEAEIAECGHSSCT